MCSIATSRKEGETRFGQWASFNRICFVPFADGGDRDDPAVPSTVGMVSIAFDRLMKRYLPLDTPLYQTKDPSLPTAG